MEKKGTARKFESSVDWILSAGMAVAVKNVGFVEYPLGAHAQENHFRLYPNDIGLLICTYDYSLKAALMESEQAEEGAEHLILRAAKGGLYEALVADMLAEAGHRELFFYRNEAGTAEIEFLLEKEDGVIPVEVKAGRSRTKTLDHLLQREEIRYGYKLAAQNVGVAGKKITLPLYMAMFL